MGTKRQRVIVSSASTLGNAIMKTQIVTAQLESAVTEAVREKKLQRSS